MPSMVAFMGDNLPWILLALALLGWLMTWLIMKWSARLVFSTIWRGIKYAAGGIWSVITRTIASIKPFLKKIWLWLWGAGKTIAHKGIFVFVHHPWWAVGGTLVGAIFLQGLIPYNYPGRQDVDVLLPWLLGFYFFVMAFVRFIMYALRRV